jgi:hypothetical protein
VGKGAAQEGRSARARARPPARAFERASPALTRGRACVHQPLHARRAAGVDHVPQAGHVDVVHELLVQGVLARRRRRRDVDDDVDALHGCGHVRGLAQVADALVGARQAAGPDVEDAHGGVAAGLQELRRDVAAEEAGAADDERGAALRHGC